LFTPQSAKFAKLLSPSGFDKMLQISNQMWNMKLKDGMRENTKAQCIQIELVDLK